MALTDQHLADLHQRARELGVPKYRMLTRDELIEAIESAGEPEAAGGGREEAVDAGLERPRREPERRASQGGGGGAGQGGPGGGGGGGAAAGLGGPRREPERRASKGEGGEPEQDGPEEDGEERAEPDTEEVSGVLDRMPQGYGFLRLDGLREAAGDVYVSASQIRR